MAYRSTKTYTGLSVAFRQWRAASHCRFIHGYALTVRLEFEADQLDQNNWVVDFGGLKEFKEWLEIWFDHKLLVAHDDPFRPQFEHLAQIEVARIRIVQDTGCEAFAKMIYDHGVMWLEQKAYAPRVRMYRVEVREHGANSAIYLG